jgi:hypothetical protein
MISKFKISCYKHNMNMYSHFMITNILSWENNGFTHIRLANHLDL